MKYKYYTATIACRDNNIRTVTITTDASNSLTKELTLTGCSVEMDSDDDVFTPLRAMRGKLSVFCNDEITISDLLPSSTLAHTIQISSNGNIEFVGYITADSSTQAYPPQGEDFELQFVSRLGIAEKIEFSPLDSIATNVLCPIVSILRYCFTLLGFDSSSIMSLPIVWPNGGYNLYTNSKISLFALCNYTDIESLFVYTSPDSQAAKYSDVTVASVLEIIAKTFLFTISENGNDILALTPFHNNEYVKYSILNVLPNATASSSQSASKLPVTNITEPLIDSSVDYHNAAHKVAVVMDMKADENPWNLDDYKFTQNGHRQIIGLSDFSPYFGQQSIGGLMTVSSPAFIIDAPAPVNFEKCAYIYNSSTNPNYIEYVTFTFTPHSYLYDEIYRKLQVKLFCKRYATITDDDGNVTKEWQDSSPYSIQWKLRGHTFTPDGYTIDVAHIDQLDPTHTPKPPFIGTLELTVGFRQGYWLFALEDCSAVCMVDTLYTLPKRNVPENVTYQHFSKAIGEDYEVDIPLCDHYTMQAYQFNCIFDNDKPSQRAIGNTLRNLIISQKCNPWHTINLSQTIRDIPKIVYRDGRMHLLTGFSRDYMNGIDKLNLTSISQ